MKKVNWKLIASIVLFFVFFMYILLGESTIGGGTNNRKKVSSLSNERNESEKIIGYVQYGNYTSNGSEADWEHFNRMNHEWWTIGMIIIAMIGIIGDKQTQSLMDLGFTRQEEIHNHKEN